MATTKSTVEVQRIFLSFIISNGALFTRVQNIFNAENFDRSLRSAAKFIQQHVVDYNAVPTLPQVNAVASTTLESVGDIRKEHEEWFLEEFERFTKICELERAILQSADLLDKGDFEPIEKLVKDAVQITLTRDLGIDYFKNPKERLMRLKNSNGQVSTGWRDIDEKLYGGFNRGEINIFCGAPGTGKSLFLQNIALNWMSSGLRGIYVTCELSEDLVAMRLDSMLTGFSSKEIFKNLDDVELKVSLIGKKSGRLKIKYLPSQSSVNHIKAYIKELAIQQDFIPDFICIDYLDLLMPGAHKVDVGDVFTKDKLVSEELRNFAIELHCLMATASQLNRSSYEEIDFSPASIAGGISKMNTADNLFGIFTSRIMKERGAIQLQFLKTRNSGGVGQKVDLTFDVDSLRITDAAEGTVAESVITGNNILAKVRSKAGLTNDSVTPENTGSNNQNNKNLLNNLLKNINNK